MHGGPLLEDGSPNFQLQYHNRNGKIQNTLLAMSVQLTGQQEGEGGFCIVKGSHKINYPVPHDMAHGFLFKDHVHQPVVEVRSDIKFF